MSRDIILAGSPAAATRELRRQPPYYVPTRWESFLHTPKQHSTIDDANQALSDLTIDQLKAFCCILICVPNAIVQIPVLSLPWTLLGWMIGYGSWCTGVYCCQTCADACCCLEQRATQEDCGLFTPVAKIRYSYLWFAAAGQEKQTIREKYGITLPSAAITKIQQPTSSDLLITRSSSDGERVPCPLNPFSRVQ